MGGPGFCGWEAWAEEVAADDLVPVSKLSKPARQFQYQQLLQFIKKSVVNNVTADYKQVLQLAFLDALTYDKGTKSGGANGSVRFEDIGELKGVLEQVSKAKDDFEKSYPAPIQISWADMIVMSGYFKLKEHFAKTILDRAQDSQGGQVILNAYGNDVPVPPLGRVDAESADALKLAKGVEDVAKRAMEAGLISGQVVALAVAFPGEASIEEVEEKLAPLDKKFQSYVGTYQRSRRELTQTSYQIDVGRAFAAASMLGAKLDIDRYLYPVPKPKLPKKL